MGEFLFIIILGVSFIFLLNGFNFNRFIDDLKDSYVWLPLTMAGLVFFMGISGIYLILETGYDITSKEYELTQISEDFILYNNDGKESVIELSGTNVEIIPSDRNKVIFEKRTYDESNFINSILYTPSSTEIKIYIKVVE